MAYYPHAGAKASRSVTVVSNRVGDVFLLLFISYRLAIGGSSFYAPSLSSIMGGLLSILVVLAAITKRAMFPWVT